MKPAVARLSRSAASALRLQQPTAFICSGCLHSRQQSPLSRRLTTPRITTPPPKSHYSTLYTKSHPPAPVKSGIACLSSRSLLRISGPDAAKYLQGVVTANIASLTTTSVYAAFLTAKGRVLHDVIIYPELEYSTGGHKGGIVDSFLIEVDAAEAARLQAHIKRYKLRAKFDISLLDPATYSVYHGWASDPAEDSRLESVARYHKTPNQYVVHESFIQIQRDHRAPGLGYRIIMDKSIPQAPVPGAENILLGLEAVPEPLYHLHRYRLGIPEGQSEILRDQALPLESNIDIMGGIDFRKGCYVGQELTIRTKHRGVVRKRILPVTLMGDEGYVSPKTGYNAKLLLHGTKLLPPAPEARITRKEKPDRRVGQWLAGMGNIGLAVCRLETMTDIQVPGETASTGYDPERDEFVVTSGSCEEGVPGPEVKVKATVPEWMRSALMEDEK